MRYDVNKKGKDSKKWTVTLIGISGVMFIYIVSSIAVCFVPFAAQYLVSLATSAITFLGSLTLLYNGAQATVEYAAINKNTNISESIQEQKNVEIRIIEDKKNEYAQKYSSDESYASLNWVESQDEGDVWR